MSSMIGSYLPLRFRGAQSMDANASAPPSWLNKKCTPLLQNLAKRACLHPIHTIFLAAFLASTTYIGLLDGSLFESIESPIGKAEWTSLVEGSRHLSLGSESSWKWQTSSLDKAAQVDDHLALLTLVFPDTLAADSTKTAPLSSHIPQPQNLSVTALPSTQHALSSLSRDSALAFAVPYEQAAEFLALAQELPSTEIQQDTKDVEQKLWIMKAARSNLNSGTVKHWATNAWTSFVDLLKNAETLDIVIMALGYMSMHLTFVSLFMSMRRMGSNFWLFAMTLFSSVFAFLFGLYVTTKMGVPINMVLLSEGLPFLVVTIGFEKEIILTKAVLTAALDTRKVSTGSTNPTKTELSTTTIQHAIQTAIRDKGFAIVRDYVIEICILVAGAASGVQGGLQQFCFLAAWILFFDCILLFTFYTAILMVKLEINRIKRHVSLRQALEDDGVNRRVAESVAQSDDKDDSNEPHIFGGKVRDSSIPRFKVLMMTGFVLINVINLCTIPFRGGKNHAAYPTVSALQGIGLTSVVAPAPMDPFKVASNGLDVVFEAAKARDRSIMVSILTPIKYELEYPSVHYGLPPNGRGRGEDTQATGDYGMGGRVVDSLLKSLEDPILSKWILVALGMSIVLNGYLFNAARWSIKEPLQLPPPHAVDPDELAQAERFNDGQSTPALNLAGLGNANSQSTRTLPPLTPATTDDEEDVLTMTKHQPNGSSLRRTQVEMERLLQQGRAPELNDRELIELSMQGKIPGYALEKTLKDTTRAVKIRRAIIARTPATTETTCSLEKSKLPYQNYNFDMVLGACCENVIGYMPLPLGVAGPLVIDGQSFFLPMATTEGVLVASTSRGCKAINSGGGAVTVLTGDGMTRGPCVAFETLERAGAAKIWLDSEAGQKTMMAAFNSTSRFARLQTMKTALAGTYLYIRFKTTTGDAMGMNMISKGVEKALNVMVEESGFEDMKIISLSGNYCTDKKAAAINWIDGRGKSVVAEAIIPGDVVRKVLKSDVDSMVELNIAKNLVGSAMAGAMGGFNAHAANILTAIYIATGQDPAQNVESSNCITLMKK